MTKKSGRELEDLNIDLAFKAGIAFYNNSLEILKKIEPDREGSHQRAFEHHADLFVSATNRAFSIELLLKACWIASDSLPKTDHDLFVLYDEMPNQKLKDVIADVYGQLVGQIKNETLGFDIALTPVNRNSRERDDKANSLDRSSELEAVLKRVGKDFELWRYFFEKGSAKEVRVFSYEFKYMQFIFTAIRAALLDKYDRPH